MVTACLQLAAVVSFAVTGGQLARTALAGMDDRLDAVGACWCTARPRWRELSLCTAAWGGGVACGQGERQGQAAVHNCVQRGKGRPTDLGAALAAQ